MTPKLKKLNRQREAIDGSLNLWRVKAHAEGRAALREELDRFFAEVPADYASVHARLDNAETDEPCLTLIFPHAARGGAVLVSGTELFMDDDLRDHVDAATQDTLRQLFGTLAASWCVLVNAYSADGYVIWRRDGTEEFDDETV